MGRDLHAPHACHDLAGCLHLLIAGSTGTGKSGVINSLMMSIPLQGQPDDVKMVLVDPKRPRAESLRQYSDLIRASGDRSEIASNVLRNANSRDGESLEAAGTARRAQYRPVQSHIPKNAVAYAL